MKLNSWRQWLALTMLIAAGLASLATSYPSYDIRIAGVSGRVMLGDEPVEIELMTRIDWAGASAAVQEVLDPPRPELRFGIRSYGWERQPSLEAYVTGPGTAGVPDWQTLPLVLNLAADDCNGICDATYLVRLRQADPSLGRLAVHWRAQLHVPFARLHADPESVAVIDATYAPSAPPIEQLVGGGLALGALIAVLLALVTGRVATGGRRLALMQLGSGAVLLMAAAVLLAGAIVQGLSTWLAVVALAGAGVVAIGAQVAIRPRVSQPRLLPTLLLLGASGTAVQGLVGQDVYRPHDVILGIGALGCAVLLAVPLTWPALRQAASLIPPLSLRTKAGAVIGSILALAMLVMGLAFALVSILGAVLLGLLRLWLGGVGTALPVFAGLVVPAVLLVPPPVEFLLLAVASLGNDQPADMTPLWLLIGQAALFGTTSVVLALLSLRVPPPLAPDRKA